MNVCCWRKADTGGLECKSGVFVKNRSVLGKGAAASDPGDVTVADTVSARLAFAFAPILLPLCVETMGRAIKTRRRLRFDRTKKSADPKSSKPGPCFWACKVLGGNRTKMFHVKHF
jgi:hypothetical protein